MAAMVRTTAARSAASAAPKKVKRATAANAAARRAAVIWFGVMAISWQPQVVRRAEYERARVAPMGEERRGSVVSGLRRASELRPAARRRILTAGGGISRGRSAREKARARAGRMWENQEMSGDCPRPAAWTRHPIGRDNA